MSSRVPGPRTSKHSPETGSKVTYFKRTVETVRDTRRDVPSSTSSVVWNVVPGSRGGLSLHTRHPHGPEISPLSLPRFYPTLLIQYPSHVRSVPRHSRVGKTKQGRALCTESFSEDKKDKKGFNSGTSLLTLGRVGNSVGRVEEEARSEGPSLVPQGGRTSGQTGA